MKQCFKCKQEKELSEFYAHKETSDGHLGKCKECTKLDVLEHRKKHVERIRAYDRERGKLPHRVRANTERNKLRRKLYPQKYIARNMVSNAVRDNRLFKPKLCSKCDIEARIYGHHEDYYKPLDVIWLCQVCHIALHTKQQ